MAQARGEPTPALYSARGGVWGCVRVQGERYGPAKKGSPAYGTLG